VSAPRGGRLRSVRRRPRHEIPRHRNRLAPSNPASPAIARRFTLVTMSAGCSAGWRFP